MKYPVRAGWRYLFSYDTGTYLPVNTNAPVYCYYDDMDLVVFKVVFNYGSVIYSGTEEVDCIEVSIRVWTAAERGWHTLSSERISYEH